MTIKGEGAGKVTREKRGKEWEKETRGRERYRGESESSGRTHRE